MMRKRMLLIGLVTLLLQACAFHRSVEVENMDGSKSKYDFVSNVEFWGPNTTVSRVTDCNMDGEKPTECYKHDPQEGYGDGIARQVTEAAMPAAIGFGLGASGDTVNANSGGVTVTNATSNVVKTKVNNSVTNPVPWGGGHK